MSTSKHKYDVAISFAEEDREIAEKIRSSCKELGLEVYFYKDETAENWGEDLFGIIMDRYRDAAKFALILISKYYVKKKWTNIERQVIQSIVSKSGHSYLLPLRLDDTTLEGMTENTLYAEWRGDAGIVAKMINEKVGQIKISKQKEEGFAEKSIVQKTDKVYATNGGIAIGNVGGNVNKQG